MRTAHAAGYWQRIDETKDALPFLRYQTAGDDRVRPEHAAWDGVTLAVDDGWWTVHYAPCDWGCRCTVIQVSQRQADRDGGATARPAAFPPRSYTNPRTGEVVRVEGGIGPGWGYNVGKAYLERDTPSPMGKPADAGPDGEAIDAGAAGHGLIERKKVSADLLLDSGASAEEAHAAFLGGFGVAPDKSRIVADPSGDGLVVGPGLFKDSVGKPVALSEAILRALPLIGLERCASRPRCAAPGAPGPDGLSLLTRQHISPPMMSAARLWMWWWIGPTAAGGLASPWAARPRAWSRCAPDR